MLAAFEEKHESSLVQYFCFYFGSYFLLHIPFHSSSIQVWASRRPGRGAPLTGSWPPIDRVTVNVHSGIVVQLQGGPALYVLYTVCSRLNIRIIGFLDILCLRTPFVHRCLCLDYVVNICNLRKLLADKPFFRSPSCSRPAHSSNPFQNSTIALWHLLTILSWQLLMAAQSLRIRHRHQSTPTPVVIQHHWPMCQSTSTQLKRLIIPRHHIFDRLPRAFRSQTARLATWARSNPHF